MKLQRQSSMRHERGFTLVELLVVGAIMLTLLALLLPTLHKARAANRRAHCASNIKQFGLAFHSYHDSNKQLPFVRTHHSPESRTWVVALLPYIGQPDLYRLWFDAGGGMHGYDSPTLPPAARETVVPMFFCPARRSPPEWSHSIFTTNNVPHSGICADYAVSVGTGNEDGAFVSYTADTTGFATITDGLSNTLLLGEKHVPLNKLTVQDPSGRDGCIYNGANGSAWRRAGPMAPLAKGPLVPQVDQFGSCHPGICQFVFGDGTVRALAVDIDPETLRRLAVRNDGLPVQP